MNIGELGKKYYWSSESGLNLIKHGVGEDLPDEVIVCRTDIGAQGNKPVTVRPKKMTARDLELEDKELTVYILDDFKREALKRGFDKDFLEEYIRKDS